jgi:hypothetical protein
LSFVSTNDKTSNLIEQLPRAAAAAAAAVGLLLVALITKFSSRSSDVLTSSILINQCHYKAGIFPTLSFTLYQA